MSQIRSRPFTSGANKNNQFEGIPILSPDENLPIPSFQNDQKQKRRVKTANRRIISDKTANPPIVCSKSINRMSKNLMCYVKDQP